MALRNLLILLFVPFFLLHVDALFLQYDFYNYSCPNAETIVYNEMAKLVAKDPSVAPALLRMHFHDCFVMGCDASVLLDSTTTLKAEKDSAIDATLVGYAEVDSIKAVVEQECPGVVSCADILAMSARDAVRLRGGKYYNVELGRRDGTVSLDTNAQISLPPSTFDINNLIFLFGLKGLSMKDLVVLSGAHTIGQGHCTSFLSRLNSSAPSLESGYAQELTQMCAGSNVSNITVDMDFITPKTFDTNYYKLVTEHKGLFATDAALLDNPTTKSYVDNYASQAENSSFFDDFAISIVKMGRIGVLTGTIGQIRKVCSKVDS